MATPLPGSLPPHALATAAVTPFVEGGHAIFTLHNTKTGGRFTYRVSAPKGENTAVRFFVSVLAGPRNTTDYTYLGCVYRDGSFRRGAKSPIGEGALSMKGFAWFWPRRERVGDYPHVEVLHLGACGRCGRPLTTVESLKTGVGPVCAGRG